jgi:hypothetical protein
MEEALEDQMDNNQPEVMEEQVMEDKQEEERLQVPNNNKLMEEGMEVLLITEEPVEV